MGTLKKIITTGVGAALLTEEGIRSAFSDMKVANQATDYLKKVLATQIKVFLDNIDLRKEMKNILADMTIEVEAKIKLTPSKSTLQTLSHKVKISK